MDRIAPYHLKTLLAIARLGTFQAAAERLNMTQPAVSARIRELEHHLGAPLFHKQGRGMALTARARQLVAACEPVLASLDAVLIAAATQSHLGGVVRIGTGEIASAGCIPRFVGAVQRHFPDVTLEIEIDLTARMLERLLAGHSDIVFLAGPIAHPGIRTTSLGALDLVWLAAPALPDLAAPAAIWSLPPHSPLHAVVRDAIAAHGLARHAHHTCNNVRTMIDIVAGGGGIGLFPATMVRAERAAGMLVEVFPRPAARIEFQAAIRQRESDPLILRLADFAAGLDIDPDRPAAPTPGAIA